MEGEIRQPAHSIEVHRNAKGEFSGVWKCRGDDEEEVKARLERWEAWFNERYPVKTNDKEQVS